MSVVSEESILDDIVQHITFVEIHAGYSIQLGYIFTAAQYSII